MSVRLSFKDLEIINQRNGERVESFPLKLDMGQKNYCFPYCKMICLFKLYLRISLIKK